MDPLIISVLLNAATTVGAPIIKGILQNTVGQKGADIAGAVIDSVASKLGVEPADIPHIASSTLNTAVAATETETPEILAQWVESQKLALNLQLEEMKKEPTWAWGWRPAWMWFLMVLWGFSLLFVPMINGIAHLNVATPDLAVLSTITAAYLALYMGGHTAKEIFKKD